MNWNIKKKEKIIMNKMCKLFNKQCILAIESQSRDCDVQYLKGGKIQGCVPRQNLACSPNSSRTMFTWVVIYISTEKSVTY